MEGFLRLSEKFKKRFPTDDNSFFHFVNNVIEYDLPAEMETEEVTEARAIALSMCSFLGRKAVSFGRLGPEHLVIKYGRDELLPFLGRLFKSLKAKTADGFTAAHLAAFSSRFVALALLHAEDPLLLFAPDNTGTSAFTTLYDNFANISCISFSRAESEVKFSFELFGYGENTGSCLGIGSGIPVRFPKRVGMSISKKHVQVSIGRSHTLFLVDGVVYSCGTGVDGRLGHGEEFEHAIPKLVPFAEKIVCVSAGATHSIFCTSNAVFVCGQNEGGQFGDQFGANILRPAVVFILKNRNDSIAQCFASAFYSTVLTKQNRCFVVGCRIPWRTTTKQHRFSLWSVWEGLTSQFHPADINFFTSAVIGVKQFKNSAKVFVFSWQLQSSYLQSDCKDVRCVGCYTTPSQSIVAMFMFNDPNSKDTNYFDRNCPEAEKPMQTLLLLRFRPDALIRCLFVHLVDDDLHNTVFVSKGVLSESGELVVTNGLGAIFEGNLMEQLKSLRPNTDCVDIVMRRLGGFPPAGSVFVSQDGRNKMVTLCDIAPVDCDPAERQFLDDRFNTVQSPDDVIVALCTGEEGVVIHACSMLRSSAIAESEYCRAFFARWDSSPEQKLAQLSFCTTPFALEQFIYFCETHHVRDNLSVQQLTALFFFADKFMCPNFLKAVAKAFFRPPFDISIMPDLFGLARVTQSCDLFDDLYRATCVTFPLLLDRGFIDELTKEELQRVSAFGESHEDISAAHLCRIKRADGQGIAFASLEEVFHDAELQEHRSESGQECTYLVKDLFADIVRFMRTPSSKPFLKQLLNSPALALCDVRAHQRAKLRIGANSAMKDRIDADGANLTSPMESPRSSVAEGPYRSVTSPMDIRTSFAAAALSLSASSSESSSRFPNGTFADESEQRRGNESVNGSVASISPFSTTERSTPNSVVPSLPDIMVAESASAAMKPVKNSPRLPVPSLSDIMAAEAASMRISSSNEAAPSTSRASAQKKYFAIPAADNLNGGEGDAQTNNEIRKKLLWCETTEQSTPNSAVPSLSEIMADEAASASVKPVKNSARIAVPSLADIMADEAATKRIPSSNEAGPSTSRMSSRGRWSPIDISAVLFDEEQATSTSEASGQVNPQGRPLWVESGSEKRQTAAASSFTQIMEDEAASIRETRRVTDSQMSDIKIEEQAMAELVETYIADAANSGISATITVERTHGNINDPLWAARS